jgi:hypothetical protein
MNNRPHVYGRWDLRPKNLPEPLPVLASPIASTESGEARESTKEPSSPRGPLRTPVAARVQPNYPLFLV